MGEGVGGIDVQALGGRIIAPDQGFGQAVRVVDIVKAKAALDAKAAFVGGAVDALDIFDLAVFHLQRHLTAHTTERADRFHFGIKILAVAAFLNIQNRGWHQRAGGAGLHAFAASHARAFAHRIGEIKGGKAVVAASRHADHIVDLNFTAGAHAKAALDAGIKIDPHGDVAVIQQRDMPFGQFRKAADHHALGIGHIPQMR